MPGNDAIELAGVVIETLPAGRYRVQLTNGHRVVARVVMRQQVEFGPIAVGDQLLMAVSPSDMSQGVVRKILERKT
ncbi:translation initiation factor IF-1 [bacterium]|nr:translation initiation factor IF-1 [bacterium]